MSRKNKENIAVEEQTSTQAVLSDNVVENIKPTLEARNTTKIFHRGTVNEKLR